MKKIKILLVITVCFSLATAFCQSNADSLPTPAAGKKIRITDASFFGGFMSQNLPVAGTLTDFQKLNPGSVLLKENMEDYSPPGYIYGIGYNSNAPSGGIFGAFLALSFNETQKSVAQLRCGITITGVNMTNYLSKKESVIYDTLTSSQTGQTTYRDSTIYQSYGMRYTAKQLQLDVSLLYRMYPALRWSVYGGIGINGGASLNAYTDVTYSRSLVLPDNAGYSYKDNVYITERLINKNVQEVIAYLPLGLDFRLGKKREFLKQVHLYTEFRPFISMINIPELGSFSNTGVKSIFGVRVTI